MKKALYHWNDSNTNHNYGKGYIEFSKSLFQIYDLFSTKGGIFKLYPIIDKLNVSEDQPPNSLYYIDLDSSQVT